MTCRLVTPAGYPGLRPPFVSQKLLRVEVGRSVTPAHIRKMQNMPKLAQDQEDSTKPLRKVYTMVDICQ